MLILGIDPGVNNIGIAVINFTSFKIKKHDCITWSGKYVTVLDYFTDLLTKYAISSVGIEKPFFTPQTLPKNIRTLEIIGIIKMLCELENKPIIDYSPATIKKVFTGDGRASKEDIIVEVETKFQCKDINNHTADAIAIAYTHYAAISNSNVSNNK